jgi:hypothetical protein
MWLVATARLQSEVEREVYQESALAVRFLPTKALAVELVPRDILPRPECINQAITPTGSEDQQVETATSS